MQNGTDNWATSRLKNSCRFATWKP